MTYCSKCGSSNHPVGACPSLSNRDWNAQQAARIRDASQSAARNAPQNAAKKGCLSVLIAYALLLAALVSMAAVVL